jgi:hypothetical protein
MRISYRMTSSAVLAVYVIGIIYSVLFPRHREPTMTAAYINGTLTAVGSTPIIWIERRKIFVKGVNGPVASVVFFFRMLGMSMSIKAR